MVSSCPCIISYALIQLSSVGELVLILHTLDFRNRWKTPKVDMGLVVLPCSDTLDRVVIVGEHSRRTHQILDRKSVV